MRSLYLKYGSVVIVALMVYLAYLIMKPFLAPIVSAAIIAYIFYPVYIRLVRLTKRKSISAILMCLVVLLLVVLPSLFILNSLLKDIPRAYVWVVSMIRNSALQEALAQNLMRDFGINFQLSSLLESLSGEVLVLIRRFLSSLPDRILSATIAAFFLFYFFRDGHGITKKLGYYLPFNKKDTLILMRELKKMADAVIYGQIITAVIQTVLGIIAFLILGISAPFFLGLIMLFASIIPMVGPAFVYIPLSVVMVGMSLIEGDTLGVVKGIALLVYGLGIISSVDNIIKPILISDKVKLHPGIVLVGILGGVYVFGIIGIVLGPLVLVFLLTMFNIYDMKEGLLDHMEKV